MKRPTLVLDIETVPDPDLPFASKKKEAEEEPFPPIPCHKIVAIGAALLDTAGRLRRLWVVGEGGNGDESDMLFALVAWLNAQLVQRSGLVLAGWNTRGFDMPVIVARALRHGLSFPWYYEPRGARYRYGDRHLDLMDLLADHGGSRNYSLDLAAKLIGMPGKTGCSGGDVSKLIAEDRLEDVRAYCLSDVAQTVAVFLRVQLLRGELTREAYTEAVRALLDGIERDPRVSAMMARIDRDRLLLTVPEEQRRAA